MNEINRRFPIAGTDVHIRIGKDVLVFSEIALCMEPLHVLLKRCVEHGIVTESELDTWYGKHWREVSE